MMKQFIVRDPRGRLRTVNASSTRGAISVFTKNAKKIIPGDHEVRELEDKTADWDVFKVRG